jgi:hypothetical protein
MTRREKGRKAKLETGNWKLENHAKLGGSGFEVRAPRKCEKLGEKRNSKIAANFQFPVSNF